MRLAPCAGRNPIIRCVSHKILTALCACALALAACAPTATPARPAITVISPPDGTRYAVGEPIVLNVAAASSNNIAKVEARVGALVISHPASPPSPTLSAQLAYTPSQAGTYTFTLVAVDGTGAQSEPLVWTGVVAQQITVLSTPTPVPVAATPGAACTLDAVFVSDVTIPDGTAVRSGTPFTKTWRLKNTSACDWGAGYQFVFVDRSQMDAPPQVSVAPTAKGGAVDVSVRFVGPSAKGTYTSTWQMRSPAGELFGARVFVMVRVP